MSVSLSQSYPYTLSTPDASATPSTLHPTGLFVLAVVGVAFEVEAEMVVEAETLQLEGECLAVGH